MQFADLPSNQGDVLHRGVGDRGMEHLGKRGVTAAIAHNYIALIHINSQYVSQLVWPRLWTDPKRPHRRNRTGLPAPPGYLDNQFYLTTPPGPFATVSSCATAAQSSDRRQRCRKGVSRGVLGQWFSQRFHVGGVEGFAATAYTVGVLLREGLPGHSARRDPEAPG